MSESARATAVEPVSGIGIDGVPVTDLAVLDHVRATGSLVITRGPAERLRRCDWANELTMLAQAQGVELSIRDVGRTVLILDIDWGSELPDECDLSMVKANHPSRGASLQLVRDLEG
jgi:hypothetical protein